MEIIKFNDFMDRKHEIVGLTEKEERVWETCKYVLFMVALIFVIQLSVSLTLPIPFGFPFESVMDAFFQY